MSVSLTKEECQAIYDLVDQFTGWNVRHVFCWDESDTLTDPSTSAFVKIFEACGQEVPSRLRVKEQS